MLTLHAHLAFSCRVVRQRGAHFHRLGLLCYTDTSAHVHVRARKARDTMPDLLALCLVLHSTGDDDLPTGAVTPAAMMDISLLRMFIGISFEMDASPD